MQPLSVSPDMKAGGSAHCLVSTAAVQSHTDVCRDSFGCTARGAIKTLIHSEGHRLNGEQAIEMKTCFRHTTTLCQVTQERQVEPFTSDLPILLR